MNSIEKESKTFRAGAYDGEEYESGWNVRWFLDTCNSGSCKDQA